jgi:very-short-patch-repair endonuclease
LEKRHTRFCSPKCAYQSPEVREKIRQAKLAAVAAGTHSGWKTRKLVPTFAEKFWMSVLKNNNIDYEFEMPAGKFFVDFGIHHKKIALEIDGKQHLEPDRHAKDVIKDEFLTKSGWKIFRVKWTVAKNALPEIQRFLDFYQTN